MVYWFHAHLRRKGLIERGTALNVPGEPNFNPASSSILYENTCAEVYMDDMIDVGPPDLQHASNEARAVVTEGNRLGLAQHPAKLKQPTVSKAQNDEPADERQYGGFKLATSPLARVGVDSTIKSTRVMAGVLMSGSSLSRRTQLGFYGKLVFLEHTLQETLHYAIDATRAILANGGNHDNQFYDEVVPVPAVGVRSARKFVELADSGETFHSLSPAGVEVTVAFTDAPKEGGGFSAMRKGSVVEMDVTFDPSKLPTHHSMYTEALQLAVVLRKCCRVHRDTDHSVLSGTYIIHFTYNNPLAWALTHRYSANGACNSSPWKS